MSYQIFKKAFFWNSLNVVAYKIILQLHQIFLFSLISKQLFGISGILFSTIYFLISVTNFGFDYSLFAFYRFFTQSKQNFSYLMHHIIVRMITLLVTTGYMVYLMHAFSHIAQIAYIMQWITTPLLITLVSIFISESIKKTLELFAHLAFLNRTITIIDITMLISYISTVWLYFFVYQAINLYIIFIPMAVASWIEIAIVTKRLFNFYRTLPDHDHSHQPAPTVAALYKNQMVNYINQLSKAFFSPNFMIIFISYYIGIIQTGYVKIIIDSIILLYMLLHKAVGIPSAALMSQASSMQQLLSAEFKLIFLKICNAYVQFLYSLAILFSVCMTHCIMHFNCTHETLPTIIISFTLIGFLEYLVLLYEKLFLTYHKEHLLALINSISLFILMIVLTWTRNIDCNLILLPFALIRFISVVGIVQLSEKIWHLHPILYPKLKTVLISLLVATPLFLSLF